MTTTAALITQPAAPLVESEHTDPTAVSPLARLLAELDAANRQNPPFTDDAAEDPDAYDLARDDALLWAEQLG